MPASVISTHFQILGLSRVLILFGTNYSTLSSRTVFLYSVRERATFGNVAVTDGLRFETCCHKSLKGNVVSPSFRFIHPRWPVKRKSRCTILSPLSIKENGSVQRCGLQRISCCVRQSLLKRSSQQCGFINSVSKSSFFLKNDLGVGFCRHLRF